jgi:ABC-type nickel/cobalt efflux system permease component RcnA
MDMPPTNPWVPVVSGLIVGGMALFGVWLTIRFETARWQHQERLRAKKDDSSEEFVGKLRLGEFSK